jgi:hypothetical protein
VGEARSGDERHDPGRQQPSQFTAQGRPELFDFDAGGAAFLEGDADIARSADQKRGEFAKRRFVTDEGNAVAIVLLFQASQQFLEVTAGFQGANDFDRGLGVEVLGDDLGGLAGANERACPDAVELDAEFSKGAGVAAHLFDAFGGELARGIADESGGIALDGDGMANEAELH